MGSRGPKATNIHELHGSKVGRRRPKAWPFEASLPRCPSHLTGHAKEHYLRLGRLLVAEGLMCAAYKGPFAVLCSVWGHYRDMEDAMARLEVGCDEWILLAKLRNRAASQYATLASQFGMTPNSRERVQAARKPPAPKSAWDSFDKADPVA